MEVVLVEVEDGFLLGRCFVSCEHDVDVARLIDVGLHKAVGALHGQSLDAEGNEIRHLNASLGSLWLVEPEDLVAKLLAWLYFYFHRVDRNLP